MKQTAVEWLDENLQDTMYIQYGYSDGVRKIVIPIDEYMKLKKQAKEMEKQQIGKAFLNGRIKEIGQGVLFDLQPLIETFNEYYNEIFKSE